GNRGGSASTNDVIHDFNENIHNFFKVTGYGSFTHDEDDGWGYQAYNNEASGGYINIRKTGYSINTANYRLFFIKWKTNTSYDQKFYGIRDGSQYISLYSWSDNYYTNYDNINSTDGWIITYGYFDTDFYDTETTLDFVWTPSNYPNQATTTSDMITIDWIHLVYPKQYSIVDVTAPSLNTPDHSPTNPDETDAITLSVDVSDGVSGVDEVKCYWRVFTGSWSNHTMSGSGTYTYEIGLFDIDDSLDYYFWANDSDGNDATLNNGGSYYAISVTDQTNPVISNPGHSPTNPDENDAIVFSCHVTDNDYPEFVWCYFRIDGGSWSSDASSVMTAMGGNDYGLNKSACNIGEEIEYYFKAVDNSENEAILNNGGNYYSFTVTDQTNPVISNQARNPSGDVEQGVSVTISATITDNYDVKLAKAYYRVNDGSWVGIGMTEGESNVWSASIGVFDYGDDIDFYVWAEDYNSNTNTANSDSFIIEDITDPTLSAPDHSPTNPEETDSITLYVNATDSASGIDTVLYFYRVNSGNWINGTMSGDVTYTANIGTFDIGDSLEYYFWANDTAGNTKTLNNGGSYYAISVTDQENPVLSDPSHSPTNP
ncbi:MAG: hypothetical protein KAU62_15740, partial [Candidatus Heimdallarchaeota archaeon]|nr:hypothetical protein [Candidatus Heimdallarchaeota archaeon]MCK4612608.1 hypothetical protein [Candidatus Heimdallarchaeota archaeon]